MQHKKMSHIYIGIDIHKESHTAVIINCFNEFLADITFETSDNGFEMLIKKTKKYLDKDLIPVFGLEDVNHLGRSLAKYLINMNYIVKHVSANYTSSERKNNPIISKTDNIDATCIAKVTLDKLDTLPDAIDNDYVYWTLKKLIKMRHTIIGDTIAYKNKLHANLLHNYPNYSKFFASSYGNTALAFWEKYSNPTKLENITEEELGNFLYDNSKGFFNIPKATKILELVKECSYNNGFQEERDYLIRTIISQIKHNEKQINNLDAEVNQLMKKIDCKLDTFIGIDKVSSANIMAEIGNIERFSSADKLAQYAGIAPVSFSSGSKEKELCNKYGNRKLNSLIFTLACVNINTSRNKHQPYNAIFYDYYHKKISEGKTKHQALICVMRRTVNIIYGMLKHNSEYKHPQELNNQCLEKINAEKEKDKNEKK